MLAQNHRPLRMTRPISTSIGDSPRNLNQITTGGEKNAGPEEEWPVVQKKSENGAGEEHSGSEFWRFGGWQTPQIGSRTGHRVSRYDAGNEGKSYGGAVEGKVGRLCLGDFCGELAEWKTRLKRNEAFAEFQGSSYPKRWTMITYAYSI